MCPGPAGRTLTEVTSGGREEETQVGRMGPPAAGLSTGHPGRESNLGMSASGGSTPPWTSGEMT